MKRTFCCLFHASDCSEEVECVVAKEQAIDWPRWKTVYRLVEYPASCKCGRPVPHCDPPQEELRRAYHAEDAEDA